MNPPRLLVFSSLFPHAGRPNAGLFIRERMFKVGARLPLTVVVPVPWFPFQHLLRRWKPNYRPAAPRFEEQDGFAVYFPRFLSLPGLFRNLDGLSMALCSWATLRKIRKTAGFDLIDAHFAYPDGYAATLLGSWLQVPVTITMRGTEIPLAKIPGRRLRIIQALERASRVFSVSQSLKDHATGLGIPADKIVVVGNGIDTQKFHPVDKDAARRQYAIPPDAQVLISVGGLVPRKGFHRVIEILPQLIDQHPKLLYLIVGGASPEGDMTAQLQAQVAQANLAGHVRFLGQLPPSELKTPLSAADVFVLATANEGWANVFLEAMACGLPVVATDVGGNREVVCDGGLGRIAPFGDPQALLDGLRAALDTRWDRAAIIRYAEENAWDRRVDILCREFMALCRP